MPGHGRFRSVSWASSGDGSLLLQPQVAPVHASSAMRVFTLTMVHNAQTMATGELYRLVRRNVEHPPPGWDGAVPQGKDYAPLGEEHVGDALHCQQPLLSVQMHPHGRQKNQVEALAAAAKHSHFGQRVVEPFDVPAGMDPLTQGSEFSSGLSGGDHVSLAGQCGGIAATACADVEDRAGLSGEQVQYVAVDVGEGDALVLLGKRVGSFGIAGVTGKGLRIDHSYRLMIRPRGPDPQTFGPFPYVLSEIAAQEEAGGDAVAVPHLYRRPGTSAGSARCHPEWVT